ncbi:peptidylprolyl isomerase [uncultured Maribacter sp.]|uniref:peptidylprolyl isomerase n=1 Tax=uncultured Maribacter sp. TaxID=431308 RepID=UPI0030D9E525|tara:strand:- start:1108 stop:2589 length:1482 start_codon:yes stop_codon:yes gene_type:complete
MKQSRIKNLKFSKVKNSIYIGSVILFSSVVSAQDSIPTVTDNEVEPVEAVAEATVAKKDSSINFKKIKLDGISAVVGDYVILDSDIEKTMIDLKSQGASTEDITHCGLLGKLMEDRLYANQAVQDSILVSDDEVNATGDRQLQSLVQQIGSMDKVLKYYKKEDEATFREELYKINKLRMLSERMQQDIIKEIEITPEEVRQFFNKIPEDERPIFGAELEIAQITKEPKASDEEIQKAVDKLNQIKADVEDNDASFSVKAILYSKDPGSSSKGGFYSITKETGFHKAFKDVAFSLKEGEVSEPFETPSGYHIIFVEKIRGQELDIRHILVQPEISQNVLDEAKAELDSIRKKIINKEFTFAEAALNFSDEKETKFDGGLLRNPQDFSSRFELTKMDPTLYNQVQGIKDNEITYPVLEQDPRGGPPKYKILKITNRFDEHVADFSKDYTKIQDLALTEKKYNAIKKWMDDHIEETYISVNDENRNCEFANNWVKQ